jgi:hypothetical protein
LREAIAIGAVRAMPVGFDILSARRVDWRGSRPVDGDSASRIPGGWLAGVGDGGGALRLQIGKKERAEIERDLFARGGFLQSGWCDKNPGRASPARRCR